MKYLKIPWCLLKGIVTLILFSIVIMTFPFVLVPVLLMEIGGMKGLSDKTTNLYSRILRFD